MCTVVLIQKLNIKLKVEIRDGVLVIKNHHYKGGWGLFKYIALLYVIV